MVIHARSSGTNTVTLDPGWKYLLKTVVNDWVYLGNVSFPKLFGA